jgi:ABC-2 type transport system ATP-binding protein
VARREIHADLLGLRAAGRTILLTSHDLEEAERLCDRVILLRAGEIVADGSPGRLAAGHGATPRLLVAVEGGFDEAVLVRAGAIPQGTEGAYRRFATPDPAAAIRALGEHLERERRTLIGLELKHPSLEQFYLEAMGRNARSDSTEGS